MKRYLLALDQGTTSSRAILFDTNQNIIATAQREVTQIFPKEGWVEQSPMEIYSTQYAVMMEVIAASDISANDIAGIGIVNQRETTIVWNKHTGMPVYNAIVWQCRRTASIVNELIENGLDEHIKKTTGLIPDAYFSSTKIAFSIPSYNGAEKLPKFGVNFSNNCLTLYTLILVPTSRYFNNSFSIASLKVGETQSMSTLLSEFSASCNAIFIAIQVFPVPAPPRI